uniref:Uncharacterized protein n=1 Tax=Arundo donax TaxID=35708 RepID=A0A0A9G5M3_ARUDO
MDDGRRCLFVVNCEDSKLSPNCRTPVVLRRTRLALHGGRCATICSDTYGGMY